MITRNLSQNLVAIGTKLLQKSEYMTRHIQIYMLSWKTITKYKKRWVNIRCNNLTYDLQSFCFIARESMWSTQTQIYIKEKRYKLQC